MSIDEKVLAAFYNIISESKQEMYDRIAADRTNFITVVMESVQKDHNASAVMRTCDCFGIQNLHTIEKNVDYVFQREIAKGSANWVDLQTWSEGPSPALSCIDDLKQKGYKIVSTSPHSEDTLDTIPIDAPLALFFGTEVHGISDEVAAASDYKIRIPMYGFTESFNVSVSVALCLQEIRKRLEKSNLSWKLTHEEQVLLKIDWSTKIIRDGKAVEEEIRRRILQKE